jgi:hypothetical protein
MWKVVIPAAGPRRSRGRRARAGLVDPGPGTESGVFLPGHGSRLLGGEAPSLVPDPRRSYTVSSGLSQSLLAKLDSQQHNDLTQLAQEFLAAASSFSDVGSKAQSLVEPGWG